MKILLAVVGGLLLLIFPFIVMKKAKVQKKKILMKQGKNLIVFLICNDTCSSNRLHIFF